MKMRVSLFSRVYAVAMLAVAAHCAAQSVPQVDSPVYTLHPTVREVNLDVVVTDAKGHPVPGLTRADFKIWDEGKPQTVRGFDEHSGSAVPATAAFKLPPNTYTNYAPTGNPAASFVILFDSLDTSFEYQARAFEEAMEFLKDLAPGTSVAIFDLNERMNLVRGFTTDRTILQNALQDKRAQPKSLARPGTGDDLWRRQVLNDGMTMLGRYLAGFPGRKNLIWFTVNIPGSLNSRTASLNAGAPPGSLPGAEIADAPEPEAPPVTTQNTDGFAAGGQTAQTPQNGNPANRLVPRAAPENPFQDLTNLIDDSKSTSDVLTLSRVVVYPVDPRQMMTPFEMAANPGFRFQQGAMSDVAEATGGEAFYNRNNLKSILQEIVTKGSSYYTLTYSPTDTRWDGSYRKLKVEIVGDARVEVAGGLHLEYRPGYYAAHRLNTNLAQESGSRVRGSSGEDFRLASESDAGIAGDLPRQSLQASMTIGQIPPTELILNASIKPSTSPLKLAKGSTIPDGDFMRDKFKRQPYREYDVLFATDPRGLQLPRSADGLHHGGVEFVAVVYTDQGDVVNSFKVAISLDLRENSYRLLLQNGMGTKHSIAIPVKGNYVIRLGVHDLNSDRVGALEFPLSSVDMGVAGVGQQGTP